MPSMNPGFNAAMNVNGEETQEQPVAALESIDALKNVSGA